MVVERPTARGGRTALAEIVDIAEESKKCPDERILFVITNVDDSHRAVEGRRGGGRWAHLLLPVSVGSPSLALP